MYYFSIKNDHRKNLFFYYIFVIKLFNNKAFKLTRMNLQLVHKI